MSYICNMENKIVSLPNGDFEVRILPKSIWEEDDGMRTLVIKPYEFARDRELDEQIKQKEKNG